MESAEATPRLSRHRKCTPSGENNPCPKAKGSPPKPGIPRMPTNYELFNGNNVKVGHLCWNYRGCWHQTSPQVDAHCIPWVLIHSTKTDQEIDNGTTSRRCFTNAHRY